jgi:hypothetical protein
MKKVGLTLLGLALLFNCVGCGDTSAPAPDTKAPTATNPTPGGAPTDPVKEAPK